MSELIVINYRIRKITRGIMVEMLSDLPRADAEKIYADSTPVAGGCVILDELHWEEIESQKRVLKHCETIRYKVGTRVLKNKPVKKAPVKKEQEVKEERPVKKEQTKTNPTRSRSQQKKLQRG